MTRFGSIADMENNCENTTKMLLHACCGPCSLEPVRLLVEEGVRPVIFYSNSNIYPPEEYDRRLATIRQWAQGLGLTVAEGDYVPEAWEETAGRVGDSAKEKYGVVIHEANAAEDDDAASAADAPEEAARKARCRACYRQRFEDAARFAAENGYEKLSTTLSVSPYQYTAIIQEELERAAAAFGLIPRFVDYRPYYDAATQRSRDAGMYRQNYCGCRFSMEEAQAERDLRKQLRAQARKARLEQTADARAAEEEKRAQARAEKQAYQLKQQRKRAILKSMRETREI